MENRIYLLTYKGKIGIVNKVVILPEKTTIEYLVRDCIMKYCELYKKELISFSTGLVESRYYWLDKEGFKKAKQLKPLEKLDKNNLTQYMIGEDNNKIKFSAHFVDINVFIEYLASKGCTILEPQLIP